MEPDEIREGLRDYRKRLDENIANWAKIAIIPITDEFARTLGTYNIETLSSNDEKTDEYLGESISLQTFANHIYKTNISIDEKRELINQMIQANNYAYLGYGNSLHKLSRLVELEFLVANRDKIGEEKFAASLAKLQGESEEAKLSEDDLLREMYSRAGRSAERDSIITTYFYDFDASKLLTKEYKDNALNAIIFDIGKANHERWENLYIGLKGIIDDRVASLPEGYRTMDNILIDEEYLASMFGKSPPDYNKAIGVKNAPEWVWDGKSTALMIVPENSRALATTPRQRDGEFEPPPDANRAELTGDELDNLFDEANRPQPQAATARAAATNATIDNRQETEDEEISPEFIHNEAMKLFWKKFPGLASQLGEDGKKDYSERFLKHRNGGPRAALGDRNMEYFYGEYDEIYSGLEQVLGRGKKPANLEGVSITKAELNNAKRKRILHDAAMEQLWEKHPELASQGERGRRRYSELFFDHRRGDPDATLDDREAESLYDDYNNIYRELERLPAHEIKRPTKEPDRVGRMPVLEVEGKLESGMKEFDQFLALAKPLLDPVVKSLHMPRFMLAQLWENLRETAKLDNEHMKFSSYAFDDMYSLWKPKPAGMSDKDYEKQKKADRKPLKTPDQPDNWMSQKFHDDLIQNLRNSDPKYAAETDFFKQIFGEEDSKAYLGVFHEHIRKTIKDKVAAGQDLKDAVGSTLNSFSILLENEAKASPDSLNLYHSLIDDYWIEDFYNVLKGGATNKEKPDINTYDPLADFEDKSDKNKRMKDIFDLFEAMKSGGKTP